MPGYWQLDGGKHPRRSTMAALIKRGIVVVEQGRLRSQTAHLASQSRWTETERVIMGHWHADGLSWTKCYVKMMARRAEHENKPKIADGTRGPDALARLFRVHR